MTLHAELIDHHPACLGPEPCRYRDSSTGVLGTKCRNCSRRVNDKDVLTTSAVLVSNYRCRTHVDQPVTWKGTGCRSCARDRDEPAEQQRRKGQSW